MQTTEVINSVPQLPKAFVEAYRNLSVPWGPVGYIVYKRTYSRKVEGQDRTEEMWETCERVVNAVLKLSRGAMTIDEGMRLYDHIFNLKGTVSGRAFWQLGSKTVDRIGSASLNNCYFVTFDKPSAFCFLFEMLMLGGGVGFNIQKEHVYQLPIIKRGVNITRQDTSDADFIVPDSREGWVELLARTLESFFETGKSFSYSTICVRGKGTPIKGFGGVASGPEDLCSGLEDICKIFKSRTMKRLRPIDVLDIANIIGSIVVAGNVRRSAELALGDPDDFNFLRAKRWSTGAIPSWRDKSNNTIVANSFDNIPDEFWNGYMPKEGEPYGLMNLKLCRQKGRLKDLHRIDPDVMGTNPCAEITLEDKESCNLAEIHLPNIRDIAEFKEVAELLYKVQKIITTVPHHWPEANKILEKNRRLGQGITGWYQRPSFVNEQALDVVYQHLEQTDVEFSKTLSQIHGKQINPSIKLTTIKPSGTLSLLSGVAPGAHPDYAPFYIRRVRMAANDPLVALCRNTGHHVEPVLRLDGSKDHDTMVVSFPVRSRSGKTAKEVTAIEMLETVKFLQTNWSDNSVSCTVYYKYEELDQIKDWLKANFNTSIKAISFLLHSDHGFAQAPYEEITKEQFETMAAKIKPITAGLTTHVELKDSFECEGGACPIK
jgi:adenosylcobalamin-dependent ribonucleoside-triphosphate reductase